VTKSVRDLIKNHHSISISKLTLHVGSQEWTHRSHQRR